MKIAVFGGSGKSGIPFLKKALINGHKINALVRDPDKIKLKNENLQLIKGDILLESDVQKTIKGCDAAVLLIGHVKNSPPDLQVRAVANIISAMKQNNIRRLISLTGAGVPGDGDRPGLFDKFMTFIITHLGKAMLNRFNDGINHAVMIKKSNLDWTIVRGTILTNSKGKGHYKVGSVGKIRGYTIAREDLAEFILKILEENSYIHEMPMVIN